MGSSTLSGRLKESRGRLYRKNRYEDNFGKRDKEEEGEDGGTWGRLDGMENPHGGRNGNKQVGGN